jgi:hypothetical protein
LPPIWRTYLSVFRRCFALVLICTPWWWFVSFCLLCCRIPVSQYHHI